MAFEGHETPCGRMDVGVDGCVTRQGEQQLLHGDLVDHHRIRLLRRSRSRRRNERNPPNGRRDRRRLGRHRFGEVPSGQLARRRRLARAGHHGDARCENDALDDAFRHSTSLHAMTRMTCSGPARRSPAPVCSARSDAAAIQASSGSGARAHRCRNRARDRVDFRDFRCRIRAYFDVGLAPVGASTSGRPRPRTACAGRSAVADGDED